MDKLSNFAKDQKLRLFLLVLCSLPPWIVPQHQIWFSKCCLLLDDHALNSDRWVRSTAATTSASTNLSATTSADHLSQRWLNNSRTLCFQTSSIKAADNGFWFEITTTTTIYNNNNNKFPGVHDNPPPRVQAGAQRALYNRSGEYWYQDCWHPSFPEYGLTFPLL